MEITYARGNPRAHSISWSSQSSAQCRSLRRIAQRARRTRGTVGTHGERVDCDSASGTTRNFARGIKIQGHFQRRDSDGLGQEKEFALP
jgi:hypothetical protein